MRYIAGAALPSFVWKMAPLLILLSGILLRIAWLAHANDPRWATAEIAQVAISVARTGIVGDAYLPGQGYTAHVGPVSPVFAGLIYRALGIRSPLSEFVLAGCAIGVTTLSFAFFYAAFGRLGMSRRARLCALLLCCILPLYQGMETSEFRIWEGGFGVMLAAGALLMLLRMEDSVRGCTWPRAIALALLAALLLFVSPPLGVALYGAMLLSMIATVPPVRWGAMAIIAIACLALVLGPWAMRNAARLGEPLLLRSNFGLELGMAYYPEALTARDKAAAFHDRQAQIHPFDNPPVFRRMQAAGGEVAYARLIGNETKAWISANPGPAVRLTLDHLAQYLFPPRWVLSLYYTPSPLNGLRQALMWAISLFGLAGMAVALGSSGRRWIYPALMILMPVALYAITQPIIRYRYLIFALSVFFACDLIARAMAPLQRRVHRQASLGASNPR